MNPQNQTRPRNVLLVEGQDDQHVVWALLKHHNVAELFKVEETGGVEKLIAQIPVRLKAGAGEVHRIGVILDADVHLDHRWQSVSGALHAATGVSLPNAPEQSGTIVSLPDSRLFGVWVMPDNRTPGYLEDFLMFLRPEGDMLLSHVDDFLEALPPRESCDRRFAAKDHTKARIHSYLAIQEEPGKPMGLAITCRYLDPDAPNAGQLIRWIQRMFIQ